MSTTTSQVVVGYDFSRAGREALARAIALAARAPFHILHFVCVIEPHTPLPTLPTKHIDYAYAQRVQQAVTDAVETELRDAGVTSSVHFFVHARIGRPAHEILALARDVGADLILVGTRGRSGLQHLILGSVAEKIIREARCTVEVAREKTYEHVEPLESVAAMDEPRNVPPHRYTYEDRILNMRPKEWPIH
jgi:nucleotide-binding universal stress UspA family protein